MKKLFILTGCGKTKANHLCPARDMYTGTLCKLRREYAERQLRLDVDRQACWFITSAKYGLLQPDTVINPYDTKLTDLCPADRAAWFLSVSHALVDLLDDEDDLKQCRIEIHAGAEYCLPLTRVLYSIGLTSVGNPLEGLGIGEQLACYKQMALRHYQQSKEFTLNA